MKNKTSTIVRLSLGFFVSLIGIGYLINRDFLGPNSIMYGIILEFIGFFLILTCKINFPEKK